MMQSSKTSIHSTESELAVAIRIAATFAAEPVSEPLAHMLGQAGIHAEVEFCAYNQVFQQLIDPDSDLARNHLGINILLLRIEDWTGLEQHTLESLPEGSPERASIERNVADFVSMIETAAQRSPATFVVCLCPESNPLREDRRAQDFLRQMQEQLSAGVNQLANCYFVSPDFILDTYSVGQYDDPSSNRLGHVPYTSAFFAALGITLARRIYRLRTAPFKVIVLDLDNTLWTGVAGEDGAAGVILDEYRIFLQEFLLERQRAGTLLCICSKNNEEDAWSVFRERPEMVLRREHFAAHRINWNDKSANIRSLAEELNLGLDSVIFVDDDPAVCAEVRHRCPDVTVIHLPADPHRIPPLFRHLWVFDQLKVTADDKHRTESYQQNAARESLRKTVNNFEDFLASLNLEIRIEPVALDNLSRVSQLTFRTNQFNSTTIRRSEAELKELLDNGKLECSVVHVKDRFGDYGLVGVALYRLSATTLEVDSFLMSCRVLGRGVEHRMVASLGEVADAHGVSCVEIRFVHSAKNRPIHDFLESIANATQIEQQEGTIFRLATQDARKLDLQSAAIPDVKRAVHQVYANPRATSQAPVQSLLRIASEYSEPAELVRRLSGQSTRKIAKGPIDRPSNQTEEVLLRIWEQVLSVSGIGTHDNFFEHGGDSFKAVRMFAEAEKKLQRNLSLASLFQAPTVAQLALLFEDQNKDSWSCLVPIQAHGSKAVLYCMHAAGGNVLFYKDLARYLGPEQPLYALQAQGLSKSKPWHRRVEEMATCYIQEIRSFQPQGPYFLAGSSFGGLLAYEMARQLRQQGQTIGFLGLFDTYGPGYPRYPLKVGGLQKRFYQLASRFATHWSNLRRMNWQEKADYIVDRMARAKKYGSRHLRRLKKDIAASYYSALGEAVPEELRRTQHAILEALGSYSYPTYDGTIWLFRARSQPIGVLADRELGWKKCVKGRIEIYDVEGHHGAVTVYPHAEDLAKKLIPCLDNAAGQGPGRGLR